MAIEMDAEITCATLGISHIHCFVQIAFDNPPRKKGRKIKEEKDDDF